MSGYKGFEEKKSKLGTTLLIVGVIHLGIGAGLYWVSQTDWGQNLIKVYKLNAFKKEEPPPPPEKEPEPEPEPEPPKPEPKPQEAPPPPPPQAEAPHHPRRRMRLVHRRSMPIRLQSARAAAGSPATRIS